MIRRARPFSAPGCFALLACLSLLRAELAAADMPLKLRGRTIELSELPQLDNAANTPKHVLIKLAAPLSIRERRLLEDAGVTLDAYLPDHAYLANIANANPAQLRQLSFIEWVGAWQNEWKLSPDLRTSRKFATAQRQALQRIGKQRLIIHAHQSTDIAALQKEIAAQGGAVLEQSHGYHGEKLLVDINDAKIEALSRLPSIRYLSQAAEAMPRNSNNNWIAQSNTLDMTPIWDRGLHGENQLVDLIDWDMDELHCSFDDAAPFGPTHRKIAAYFGFDQSTLFGYHGTHTASVLAGDPLDTNADDDLVGIAYASRLVFQDQAAIITPTNLGERLLIAQAEGAFVHSNSWGSNFDTSYNAWAADIDAFSFENEDNLVIFAVINGNASTPLLSPENAKNCLAVGASGSAGNQDNPGSGATGPTPDGRQKPEIWAPGCESNAANVGTACGTIERSCATSWAAPAVAGLATLTRQYFADGFYPSGVANINNAITPSGALLKAMLINSAVDMSGIEGYFGPREGFGRVLLDDALFFDGDARGLMIHDVRHIDGLRTGNMATFEFDIESADEPLKVTMCYHDAPALVGTAFAPVNNLDLVVTSPTGLAYRGNDYIDAETQANGTADAVNNTEQVTRLAPEIGTWRATVNGTAVNDGPQGFALVITGSVTDASAGPTADLMVTIDPLDQVVPVGELGAIRVTVTNSGRSASAPATLRIELDTGLQTLNRIMPGSCLSTPSSIECDLASIPAGESVLFRRSLRVVEPGVHAFDVTIIPDEPDENPMNDSARGIIRTPRNFDLQMNALDGPTIIERNTSTTYTAIVFNDGPDTSDETSVQFDLDAGLRLLQSTDCTIASETALSCSVPALASQSTHELTFSIEAIEAADDELSVRGAFAGQLIDNDTVNNALTLTLTVQAAIDSNDDEPLDSDGDSVIDAKHVCPNSDDSLDADGDGTPDGCDACPNDASKVNPELCGCGNPETDSDADGIPDCGDGCPNDPNKLDPGDCGCGVVDRDADENGMIDCLEDDTPGDLPINDDVPPQFEIELEDLDPCFVRYLMQSFLGIPMCGPCISFACLGICAGICTLRSRVRKWHRIARH